MWDHDFSELNAITRREVFDPPTHTPQDPMQPIAAPFEYETPLVLKRMAEMVEREQTRRAKGPDSGPDSELGF